MIMNLCGLSDDSTIVVLIYYNYKIIKIAIAISIIINVVQREIIIFNLKLLD